MPRSRLPRRALLGLPFVLPWSAQARPGALPEPAALRIVLPFGAGTPSYDLVALVADALAAQFGQPLLLDTRLSTRGTADAAAAAARAEPDGNVLLATTQSHLTNDLVLPGLPFDPLHDFAPVALLAEAPVVIMATTAAGGAQSLAELIGLLRRQPRSFRFASPGPGTTPHIAAQLLLDAAGVEAVHQPFAAPARMLEALATGEAAFIVNTAASTLRLMAGGTVRPLAVLASQRLPTLPRVPTGAEAAPAGVTIPDWSASYWLLAPAATPAAVLATRADAVGRILAEAGLRRHLAALGLQPPGPATPAALRDLLTAESARLRPLTLHALGKE